MATSQLLEPSQSADEDSAHIDVLVLDTPPQAPPPEAGGARGAPGDSRPRLFRSFARALRKNQDHSLIIKDRIKGRAELLPTEWWKTGVAFLWAATMLLCTTIMITIVHERVPERETNPPLPDKFFDYVPRLRWAFTVTEVIGIGLALAWTAQWICLRHRSIVARRFFFIVGVLYLYRIITMYITTLPVPSNHMNCAPKLNDDSLGKVHRVFQLVSGGGLSLTGSHMMCGDFLYSGHTVMLTLTFLFIREYSPPSLWWYHLICWALSVVGVVFILVAHEHYSVDVVVAYFITSRLFCWYHAMANDQSLRGSPHNYLRRVWWRFFFDLMERNVCCPVPCTFCSPVSLPSFCIIKNPCASYSKVQTTREE